MPRLDLNRVGTFLAELVFEPVIFVMVPLRTRVVAKNS